MRKPISFLKAKATDGRVVLSWCKSTPMVQSDPGDEFSVFRVYRRSEEAFTFGKDYEEFFLGADHAGAELIFGGTLEATGDRRFTYVDDTVAVGCTYSYFIQTKHSVPVGPLPVKVRDPQVWWSYEFLMARLRRLVDRRPALVRLDECGRTVAGRPIPCVRAGRGRPVLGLVGLIHAGEAGPELIVPALESIVENQPELLAKAGIVAVPAVNIDARQRLAEGVPWYLRVNPQGVDLNRNFPGRWDEIEHGYGFDSSDADSATYRGPEPASAPETQAVVAVFSDERPDAVLSFHALASICALPALAAKTAKDDAPYAARCRRLVELYAKGLYPDTAFSDKWFSFGCSAGSLPTWLHEAHGIPALDLESGACEPEKRSHIDLTDLPLLADYRHRHTRAIRTVLQDWPL